VWSRAAYAQRPARRGVGVLALPRGTVEAHAECLAAADRAATLLADLGHHVELGYPTALDEPESVLAYVAVVASNTARAIEAWGQKVGRPLSADDCEPLTWVLAERGRATSAPELIASIEYVHAFGRRL